MKMQNTLCLLALVLVVCSTPLHADNTGFRGDGSGSAKASGLPTTWSADQNIVWRASLPGFGASSPITLGDKIFVTCYSGYGAGAGGSKDDLKLHVTCISKSTGKILWDKSHQGNDGVKNYRGFVALHGYASHTPVTDGKAVYAFFGSSGVIAYSLSGKKLWDADVGSGTHGFGTATSPVVVGDVLVINASVESRSLIGLNKKTGKEIWRARGINSSWNTPLKVTVNGKTELVLSMRNRIASYDPETGQQNWQVRNGVNDYICTSAIVHDNVIYAMGGRSGRVFAIKTGGSGDLGDDYILWQKNGLRSNVPSPVFYKGHMYFVSDGGVAVCVNAKTGETVKKKRLPRTGRVYASVLVADGKLYSITRKNGTFVLGADKDLTVQAHNTIKNDRSVFNASPIVIGGNKLLVRSDRYLYCIGKVQKVP